MQRASSIALLLLCVAMIFIKAISGSIFVKGALERAEHYTHTCIKSDIDCHQINMHTIELEDDSASELQLFTHLLGNVSDLDIPIITPPAMSSRLIVWLTAWRIQALYSPPEHPPKS